MVLAGCSTASDKNQDSPLAVATLDIQIASIDNLPNDTNQVNLEITTGILAICSYQIDTDSINLLSSDNITHTAEIQIDGVPGNYSYDISCVELTNVDNNATSEFNFTVESPVDDAPPIRTDLLPAGEVVEGTTTERLQVTTNESAICKYSSSPNVTYEEMLNGFDSADGVLHTADVTTIDGENNYYVRCSDLSSNTNTTDAQISFSVGDTTAPVISESLPNQAQISGTVTATLQVTTNESATCRYSDEAGISYNDMPNEFTSDNSVGTQNHTVQVTSLTDGRTYNYYARCSDISQNVSREERISFTVLQEIAGNTPWSYPAIPYTDWAYNPFTIQLEKPLEWPEAPAINYYYIEQNHPLATDTADATDLRGTFGRYGYPDKPRKTLPTRNWITDIVSAGTVIWIKGGVHDNENFRGEWSPQFHGTAENPIWMYGDPEDKPVFKNSAIRMHNSSYVIFDNLQWIGDNRANQVIGLTRDRPGPTHHITLRNLTFENLNWISAGGAIVGIAGGSNNGNEVHDVVAYKNTFKNNGGGFDWSLEDGDHHGYKVNGLPGENKGVYRVWIIDNKAIVGDDPDPIDGLYKSLSGNLVQVGDMTSDNSGNNHHIYVAGNYQEYARQALGWTKRSSDVIFSTNVCTNTYALAGGNGQCYGHQYALGDYNWWINNVGKNSASGWMHTSNDNMDGPLFIVGNLFYNNKSNESDDNWRSCSGISLYNQRGKTFIVNNVFDSSCYGIWAQTNRHAEVDELHIYNNIFTNISGTIDPRARPLALENSNGIPIYIENNLFDSYTDNIGLTDTATLDALNAKSWASNNIEGNPDYIDQASGNYDIGPDSAAIDKGTQRYESGAEDVYTQFINRYSGDINYPGDPADYWPKDFLEENRINNGLIDIGPFEH